MEKDYWPELSFGDAKETYQTIHLWTQIAGKIKLSKMPWINHSWHVTLSVYPSGLTTGNIPDQQQYFQINFDFIKHQLQIITSSGAERIFALTNLSVAACYRNLLGALQELGIEASINKVPNELVNPIPFHQDEQHYTYQPLHAANLHKALLRSNEVLNQFRAEFIGKCSPVHFFWGSFDLAVSRFSGRKAPAHPGGVPNLPDWVAREAYSHEVSSCGFWPGNEAVPYAAFYSYIYPEPAGYKSFPIKPSSGFYHKDLGEFILPYKEVQQAANPTQTLLDFLQSTYEAAAETANWDRESLEKSKE